MRFQHSSPYHVFFQTLSANTGGDRAWGIKVSSLHKLARGYNSLIQTTFDFSPPLAFAYVWSYVK